MITSPAPLRSFASDNAAGIHPAALAAIQEANSGHALAYGSDRWTEELAAQVRDLFGSQAQSFVVWNGTGANVMALASMLGPAQAVVCSDWAHIHVDETGAPERILGAKLIDVPCPNGKLVPQQLIDQAHAIGQMHHAQPAVVSLTQSTELGTVYSVEEVAALCDTAHRLGMSVHMDGSRIANAVAACGGSQQALRQMTVHAGVDVLSFGTTKNGIMCGEMVVYLNDRFAASAPYIRKMVTQLPSKMRFVSAQISALLRDDLWLQLAGHSNAMARRLYDMTVDLPGLHYDSAPVVNSVFPKLPPLALRQLQEWSFFWDWDISVHQGRWMTAWDTTDIDLTRFVHGISECLTQIERT